MLKLSTKEIREILLYAANLIQSQDGWTKGAWARDSEETSIPVNSATATCWCATGAVFRATYELHRDGLLEAHPRRAASECIARLEKHMTTLLDYWNDKSTTTHEDVVALLTNGKI